MKICPNYINLKTNNIAFKNTFRLSEPTQKRECYTTTDFYRDDFDWLGFFYFINNKYKNCENVNTVAYACSNGKEIYSIALGLKTYFKDKSNKFFPLIAKDIDADCILKAKRGRFKISDNEDIKLNAFGKLGLNRYVDVFDDGLEKYAFVKDTLKEDIEFKKGNICDEIDEIPKKNTILVARNFWGYLSAKEQIELANKLAEKLDETSLVVLGSFDKSHGIHRLLEKRGFIETEIPYVMQKMSNKNPSF